MTTNSRAIPCTCTQCHARRDRARARRGRGAWLGLLAFLVAAVPLAAALPKGDVTSAPGSPVAVEMAPAPTLVPPTIVVSDEDAGTLVDWRESDPGGSPNGGSLTNAVRLPVSGTGYYTYDPRTQRAPGGLGTRWGTAHLVREVMALGEWWHHTHPDAAPLGIGDLSRRNGGAIDGHSSHQNGLDVDIRLPRQDGQQAPANPSTYDRGLAQDVVSHMAMRGASLILIGPSLNLTGPAGVVTRWPNHDDHLHIRFAG
jgi:hypothetical protein